MRKRARISHHALRGAVQPPLMMSEEQGWIKHGKKAIKRVFENKILRKLFREDVRVMKLDYHKQVTEHFDNLINHSETTLDLLKEILA